MEENFYTSPKISYQTMQGLLKKNNQTAFLRFVLLYSLFLAMGIGIVWSWNQSIVLWIGFILAFGMLGRFGGAFSYSGKRCLCLFWLLGLVYWFVCWTWFLSKLYRRRTQWLAARGFYCGKN